MNTKFTPGPYKKTSSGSNGDVCAYHIETKNRYIADVHIIVSDKDETEANATADLFSAAPDMYLELEAIERITTDLKILTGIRMVLAKARGEDV